MTETCGYVVVRRPEWCEGTGRPSNISDLSYRGIDRLRWDDFEVAYHSNTLPADLMNCWNLFQSQNRDVSGIYVLKDYEKSVEVWRRFDPNKSEIIAVWSPWLASVKGSFRSSVPLVQLGFDCIGRSERFAEWSVLSAGVFTQPAIFQEAVSRLNENGLFESEDDCRAVFAQYQAISEQDEFLCEPLAGDAVAEVVTIYAVS